MSIRLAINGYGRIGRMVLRALYETERTHELSLVAINDLADPRSLLHLTQYDSTHGRFPFETQLDDGALIVQGVKGPDRIPLYSERDPARLPWGELGIDIVLECTGALTSRERASGHLKAGAKKVLISAPAGGEVDATIVYGVNHDQLKATHDIVSNGSCTTHCLATILKPLHEALGIQNGFMTTIHAYTNDQVLVDSAHVDLRRARSATQSMIPTKTGAALTIGEVIPALKGKLDGFAVRVPTLNVSALDLTCEVSRDTTVEEIHGVMQAASENEAMRGVLALNQLPLVSVDFNHHRASAIFDMTQTKVLGRLIKVFAWYDNEWGFSNRMLDTCVAWMRSE